MKTVSDLRNKELEHLKNASYLNASFAFTFTCAPFLVSELFDICQLNSTAQI